MAVSDAVLLREAYAAYNQRDADALLALVSDDVDWPDGAERLHGKDALRAYWDRQWRRTRTHDEPLSISEPAPGRSVVRVRQVVRSLDGALVSQGEFDHTHHVDGGVIRRLDIRSVEPPADAAADSAP